MRETWRRNHAEGIMKMHHGSGLMEKEPWRRNHGGGVIEKESWRGNLGSVTMEASRRPLQTDRSFPDGTQSHPGGIQEAPTLGFSPSLG